MNTTAHGSYAFLIYSLVAWLAWGIVPTGAMAFWVVFFGICPDFDGIYYRLAKKGEIDNDFQHHLYFWTHWPISYTPLVLAFVLSLALGWYPHIFAIPVVGIYCHMLFDSIGCGDGLMWGKVPWKKDQFARYVNLFSSHTDGYHGGYWTYRYRKTVYFKLENVAACCSIVLVVLISTVHGFDAWVFLTILGFVGFIASGFTKIDPKYASEPPNGRYDDYHVHPAYVAWYEKKFGHPPVKKYAVAS
ncbi:MAG: hypothetical protein ACTSU5_09995 [Promethearchaeota archaeon]